MGKKVLILLTALIVIYGVYKIIFISRVFPNIYFAGESLSGREVDRVEPYVQDRIKEFEESQITIKLEDKNVAIAVTDLGIVFKVDESADAVRRVGRNNLLTGNIVESITTPFKKTGISPRYEADYAKLAATLSSSLAPFELPQKDATIVWQTGNFEIQEGKTGKLVDRAQLLSALKLRVEALDNSPIAASFLEEPPAINAAGAQKALERVSALEKQRIVLKYDQDSWSLSGTELINILEFTPAGLEDGYAAKLAIWPHPVIFTKINRVGMVEPVLTVRLNRQKLDEFVGEIAASIDRPTQDAQIEFAEGKVKKFQAARDGAKLDADLTLRLILEKVSIDNPNVEKDIVINLPVSVTRARIANEEINSLGIRELIGKGISYFAGSIANRIYNIGLGAGRISGTIVKPGEVFSFNGAVGEVSGKTGYRQAYVISKGRTVLDDGGGICQVSTTVFRAALNAGLPIAARTAHAYRVSYYEQSGVKPGLDATVWSPAVDLKFKNDTDKHILVQTVFYAANAKLEVDIYGTRDGRTVEISTPVVSNVKPPPEPLYQDDPTLPKGTTKQIDFAAWGATSVFSRKVYKDNKVIIDDVFKSNFRPWQAIYLVGTGG